MSCMHACPLVQAPHACMLNDSNRILNDSQWYLLVSRKSTRDLWVYSGSSRPCAFAFGVGSRVAEGP